MGKTVVEKILSNHSGEEVGSGDFVVSDIDYVMAGDAKGPKAVDIMKEHNLKFNLEPSKTDLIIDHFVPVQSTHWANHHKKLRDFSIELSTFFISNFSFSTPNAILFFIGSSNK